MNESQRRDERRGSRELGGAAARECVDESSIIRSKRGKNRVAERASHSCNNRQAPVVGIAAVGEQDAYDAADRIGADLSSSVSWTKCYIKSQCEKEKRVANQHGVVWRESACLCE